MAARTKQKKVAAKLCFFTVELTLLLHFNSTRRNDAARILIGSLSINRADEFVREERSLGNKENRSKREPRRAAVDGRPRWHDSSSSDRSQGGGHGRGAGGRRSFEGGSFRPPQCRTEGCNDHADSKGRTSAIQTSAFACRSRSSIRDPRLGGRGGCERECHYGERPGRVFQAAEDEQISSRGAAFGT